MCVMMEKASVVIPTFNKVDRLKLVLQSYNYQTTAAADFEVIVVDDGSTDGTREMVGSFESRYLLRYVYQKNSGRSHARNKGINTASYPIIILCDDDLIVSKSFIHSHRSSHSKFKNRVVHGLIYNLPYLKFFYNPSTAELYPDSGTETGSVEYLKTYSICVEDIKDLKKIENQKKVTLFEKQIQTIFKSPYPELKWLGFTGGNVSFSVELVEAAGMFDEELDRKWGCEDLELGYRMFKSGAEFIYCEDACNYHMAHHRTTFKEDLEFSVSRFYAKHKDPLVLYLPKLLLGEERNIGEYLKICREAGNEDKKDDNDEKC